MEVQLKRPTPGDASPAQLNNQVFAGMQAHHTAMMSCKDVDGKSVTVEDGAVGFAATDDTDANQQWVMDDSSGRKDGEGNPAFALVNLGTWMAIQIPIAAKLPVRLVPYKPNTRSPDISLLWTAKDAKNGFSFVREYKSSSLVLDAAHQGLQVVASNYNGGDSQLWSILRMT